MYIDAGEMRPMNKSEKIIPGSEGLHFVKSVEKAFAVLESFNDGSRELSLADIIEKTGLDKNAVRRFTHTLQVLGYLGKDQSTRRYMLTRRSLIGANSFLMGDPLITKALPHIVELRRQFDLRVGCGCIEGREVMYLIPLQSLTSALNTGHPGFKLNVYATATGRAILANWEPEEARALIESCDRQKITSMTLTDTDDIMLEIDKAREQGYCISAQESGLGNVNIAVPIFNNRGQAIAAVAAIGSTSNWTVEELEKQVAPVILSTARAISMEIKHINDPALT